MYRISSNLHILIENPGLTSLRINASIKFKLNGFAEKFLTYCFKGDG